MNKRLYLYVCTSMILILLAFPLGVMALSQVEESAGGTTLYGGHWSSNSGAGASGSYVQSNTTGDYLTYTFTGSYFELHGFQASIAGIVDVYVDDVLQGSFDGYAPSNVPQALLYSQSVAYGTHTIKAVVTGTKNASATDYYIFFDFYVLNEDTPTPTHTVTNTPINTDTPVPGPTNTPVPGPTNTPVPGPTNTPVPGSFTDDQMVLYGGFISFIILGAPLLGFIFFVVAFIIPPGNGIYLYMSMMGFTLINKIRKQWSK